jgi:hypothetical protein
MGSPWRYLSASVVGSSHLTLGTSCQDASRAVEVETQAGPPALLCMAADGAGSAERAEVGARLAQQTFWSQACLYLRETPGGVASITRDAVVGFLNCVLGALASEAAAEDRPLRDYACTFLAAIVDAETAVFCQIGDGVIVRAEADGKGYAPVTWPENGEYANSTYFLTAEDAFLHLQFAQTGQVDEFALLTDGLQSLALRLRDRAAHGPFFAPFFDALRAEPPGPACCLTPHLEAWLASPAVLARTDDDKTLILATYRPPAPPAPEA